MNPIKHLLAGLCSSLLLSLNRETAASIVMRSSAHDDWTKTTSTSATEVQGCIACLPSQFAES
ncbi:MAG: hypothetical protein C0502_00020 [Opitutus sp.]|nr:hypothetical protein [Opitutus sp.]